MCVLSKVDVSIITLCMCLIFVTLSLFLTQHIFLLHCIVALLGRGGWVVAVCTFIGMNVLW